MKSFYASLIAAGLLASCSAEHIVNAVPLVITGPAQYIQGTSATLPGNADNDAGTNVTETGFVMSMSSQKPSLQDTKIAVGQSAGTFSGIANNLQPLTTYYYRAYATNANGTGYGDVFDFTTLPAPCQYNTQNLVTVGSQDISINGVEQQTNMPNYFIYGNAAYFTEPVNNTVITLQFFEPGAMPPQTGVYTTIHQFDINVDPQDKDLKVYISNNGQNNTGSLANVGQYVFVENSNGVITFTFCDTVINGGTVLNGTFTYE